MSFGRGSQAAPLADRGNDLYETPPQAVESLLAAETLPTTLWEPACGPGSIVRVLRSHGHVVYATDLVDYDSPDQDESRWDFLMQTQLPIGVQAIVTNPPFKLATEFAHHGLNLGVDKMCLLLRLAFIEAGSSNSRLSKLRREVLEGGQLAKMLVFRNRLPMMHRDGWGGPKISSSGLAFAWFIWNRDHSGPTTLNRISW